MFVKLSSTVEKKAWIFLQEVAISCFKECTLNDISRYPVLFQKDYPVEQNRLQKIFPDYWAMTTIEVTQIRRLLYFFKYYDEESKKIAINKKL